MRRDNRRKPVDDGLDVKKMVYITGSVLALAVIVFVITFLLYSNKLESQTNLGSLNTNKIGNISTEEASTQYGKTVNEVKGENIEIGSTESSTENKSGTATQSGNASNSSSTSKSGNTSNSSSTSSSGSTNSDTGSKVAINTSAAEQKVESSKQNENKETDKTTETEKVPDPEFVKPVDGAIIKEFADNKLVYSSTLDVWSTHNGIDIEAEQRSVVKASADGTITSIKNDPRYGLTVIIEHVNGYKTVYANLLSTEFVKQGEKVKQGQSIGTVGNTAAFEISDEAHLHFELLKDNEQQDPELYLN